MKQCGKEGIIKMDKKQYNNVIDWTLKHEQSAQTEDSLATARAIFNNMGVALPSGDIKEVCETLKTDDYMGWKSCTMQEAQQAADNGDAAIAISEDRIVVLSATDDEEPVAQTASVMTLSENTSAYSVDGMRYYSYSYGSTTTIIPQHHNWQYYANLIIEHANSFLGMSESQVEAATGFDLTDTAWCVDFVRLCCNLAGAYRADVNIKNTNGAVTMKNWFADRNLIFDDFTKIQPGDIVFTGNVGANIRHACIAISGWRSDGSVETINGNWSKSVKKVPFGVGRALPYSGGQDMKCFAHPDYEAAND